MLKIILDAGHGQNNASANTFDEGASGNGHDEAALAWAFVNSGVYVAKEYFAGRLVVGLTRDTATESAPVAGRDDEAAREGGDLLISVHYNAGPKKATGTETLFRDQADKKLARIVQTAAVEAFGLRDRGVKSETESKRGRLAIFGGAMPTCLLEVGFITNPDDLAASVGDPARDARIKFWRQVFTKCLEEYDQ